MTTLTATRLKFCREQNNKTLEEIGTLLGVHKSTVSRWESGETDKISLATISTLANYYNVSEAWLSGKNVDMNTLTDVKNNNDYVTIPISSHEKNLIVAYRQQPHMQEAVDKLLGVEKEAEKEKKRA